MPKLKPPNNKPGKGKKKAKDQAPETADEYLAAGVELEEAGEKWRGGDAAKSMRFFLRAIDLYSTGLTTHPSSFDLAYNKARIQYEITQHPRLVTQLSASLIDVLAIALESHREALRLNQENEDVLFNTAQVLTSLAEAMTDRNSGNAQDALKLLQEALELFQRCLLLQEYRFTESQEMELSDPADDEGMEPTTPESEPSDAERWATVVEPVTKDTLIDTAVAQMQTLTVFCGLLSSDPGSGLAWVEEYWASHLQRKIDVYLNGSTDRQLEVDIARANFIAALADMSFRTGRINIETYQREITNVFTQSSTIMASQDGLLAFGEARISVNAAISDTSSGVPEAPSIRWEALSSALETLQAAVKLGEPMEKHLETNAKAFIMRGDAEMLRFRLGQQPWNHATAQKSAKVLLKNAQTYYRGGAELARRAEMMDENRIGKFKEGVATAITGAGITLQDKGSREEVLKIAEDMVEDGLIDEEEMRRLLSAP